MAGTVNKVFLLGRFTRDPEARVFAGGGKVVNFGFAVDGNRKKNASGQWETEPCFLDCAVFDTNRDNGPKMASMIESSCQKGSRLFIEGHLVFEQWSDQSGGKRSKLKVVVEQFTFIDAKSDAAPRAASGGSRFQAPRASEPDYEGGGQGDERAPMDDASIPF